MPEKEQPAPGLPSPEAFRRAIDLYLELAYEGSEPPAIVAERLPGATEDFAAWLAGEAVERDPGGAPPEEMRSASLRLGNALYPNMKLRISRPPQDRIFLFSVDSHDAVLQAPEGTPDHAMLEELKAHNARLASAITARWEQAGLPTERNYLRHKIEQTRDRGVSQKTPPAGPGS